MARTIGSDHSYNVPLDQSEDAVEHSNGTIPKPFKKRSLEEMVASMSNRASVSTEVLDKPTMENKPVEPEVLSNEEIRQRILPQLLKRYFGDLRVRSVAPGNRMYRYLEKSAEEQYSQHIANKVAHMEKDKCSYKLEEENKEEKPTHEMSTFDRQYYEGCSVSLQRILPDSDKTIRKLSEVKRAKTQRVCSSTISRSNRQHPLTSYEKELDELRRAAVNLSPEPSPDVKYDGVFKIPEVPKRRRVRKPTMDKQFTTREVKPSRTESNTTSPIWENESQRQINLKIEKQLDELFTVIDTTIKSPQNAISDKKITIEVNPTNTSISRGATVFETRSEQQSGNGQKLLGLFGEMDETIKPPQGVADNGKILTMQSNNKRFIIPLKILSISRGSALPKKSAEIPLALPIFEDISDDESTTSSTTLSDEDRFLMDMDVLSPTDNDLLGIDPAIVEIPLETVDMDSVDQSLPQQLDTVSPKVNEWMANNQAIIEGSTDIPKRNTEVECFPTLAHFLTNPVPSTSKRKQIAPLKLRPLPEMTIKSSTRSIFNKKMTENRTSRRLSDEDMPELERALIESRNSYNRQFSSADTASTGDIICCTYPKCNEIFEERVRFVQHVRTHGKLEVCTRCWRVFPDRRKLALHSIIYMTDSHIPCDFDYCDLRFKSVADLKTHLTSHYNRRPFICPKCYETFSENHEIEEHVGEHTARIIHLSH